MPIFSRTFDLLSWLMPVSAGFPKTHRQGFTLRLQNAAFDLRERLEEAQLRRGLERLQRLQLADEALARVRVYMRLAVRWRMISLGQYEHAGRMVEEIGRLLGGWHRATEKRIT